MVENEPNSTLMNLNLSKFVEEIKCLFHDGIQLTHKSVKYLLKFCVLGFTVDSVCRPILQNRIQFNGYYGCSWCYQLCKYIKEVHGKSDRKTFLQMS